MDFSELLTVLKKNPDFPDILIHTVESFYPRYKEASVNKGIPVKQSEEKLIFFLDLVSQQLKSPFIFESYHRKIKEPKDLYRFGIDFIMPLVQFDNSTVQGLEIIEEIQQTTKKGENVILFANHQIEPDPQAISLLLERTHPQLAEEMIFVAGHRVTTDPLAVPFSMGCNLLCIYSKKYIDHPPEKKQKKIAHNQNTMKKMRDLLTEGGKCIFVAPSGGRDRPNTSGIVEIAPFDHQSIEMFRFIAKRSKTPSHFYPMALNTYDLLPPPDHIKNSLGESRIPKSTPIHLAFGNEIIFDHIPVSENQDKKIQRIERTRYIQSLVNQLYQSIA